MANRKRTDDIFIIHGHVPSNAAEDEKDVLVEAENVSKAVKELGYSSLKISVDLNLQTLESKLRNKKPALIFNLVESISGSSRFIAVAPSLFENLNIPFTGSGSETLYVTTNKPLSKSIMQLHSITTPAWQTCNDASINGILFKPPYIIKSIWEHASIGLNEKSVHFSKRTLSNAIKSMNRAERSSFFFEQYIKGREFNISVLYDKNGLKIMPPAEMIFEGFGNKLKIVDYAAKWDADSFNYHHTNRSFNFNHTDKNLIKHIREITLKCCSIFNIMGYARVDFRVNDKGVPYVLEVNANPCISPDSGFTAACMKHEHDYNGIINKIITAAMHLALKPKYLFLP